MDALILRQFAGDKGGEGSSWEPRGGVAISNISCNKLLIWFVGEQRDPADRPHYFCISADSLSNSDDILGK
jgi:hypothetical protein